MKCPMCKGNGELPKSWQEKNKAPTNKIMARLLRKEGFSIRQIQKFLGYKSTRSVHIMVKDIKL